MEGHHCTIQEMATATPKKVYKGGLPFYYEPTTLDLVLGDEHFTELFTKPGVFNSFRIYKGIINRHHETLWKISEAHLRR